MDVVELVKHYWDVKNEDQNFSHNLILLIVLIHVF